MTLTVACPECSTKLSAPDSAAGRKVKCPKCGTAFALTASAANGSASSAGVRSSKAGPPSSPLRSPQPEEDDDTPSRARRRRFEDDDEDEEDRPRSRLRRRRSSAEGPATGLQMGLGIAGLVLGILGLIFAFIPCLGLFVTLPLGGIGLVLGLVGLVVGIVRKGGLGFPIAGSGVSAAGLVAALVMWFVVAAWFRSNATNIQANMAREMEAAARRGQDQHAKMGIGAKGPVVMQTSGQLTQADPRDKVPPGSPCKVFTVSLAAGKTYWIDMTAPQFDSYLRLENSTGQELARDDDGGGALNARIIFLCPRNDAYRVIATSLGPAQGNFNLKVQEQ